MTDDETRNLDEFLVVFDAVRLGEGDVIAGANTLAAMAVSIANLQRPGSGLVAADLARVTAGADPAGVRRTQLGPDRGTCLAGSFQPAD